MVDYTQYDIAVREIAPQLQYSAEFVPLSKSRNASEKYPTLNWRVTFTANGPGARCGSLTTDYMQGIAHLPGYNRKGFNPRSIDGDKAIQQAVETGLINPFDLHDKAFVPIPVPAISEVLCCLLSDASAIDFPDFEDWADNYGYDSDSRKAESIYRACLDIGLKLRNMLGEETLDRLREALQDM